MGPVLLYDGTCGFCAGSVRLVLRHDRKGTLRFAALDSSFGRALLERHPELAGVDSMLWVEPSPGRDRGEMVLIRSRAALEVARYLGGPWRLAGLGRIIPRPLRDVLYRFIARHRHHLTGGGRQCLLPSPEAEARFLP